jgi:ABC-type polar amino acid transport system ATPase subunit
VFDPFQSELQRKKLWIQLSVTESQHQHQQQQQQEIAIIFFLFLFFPRVSRIENKTFYVVILKENDGLLVL